MKLSKFQKNILRILSIVLIPTILYSTRGMRLPIHDESISIQSVDKFNSEHSYKEYDRFKYKYIEDDISEVEYTRQKVRFKVDLTNDDDDVSLEEIQRGYDIIDYRMTQGAFFMFLLTMAKIASSIALLLLASFL